MKMLQTVAPFGFRIAAPADGVVVRWLFYSDLIHGGAAAQLRIVAPAAAGAFTVMRSGDVQTLDPVTTTPATPFTNPRCPAIERASPVGSETESEREAAAPVEAASTTDCI